MSATIFATFEQQELAELAMGRLRSNVNGIHAVQFIRDYAPPIDDQSLFSMNVGYDPYYQAYGPDYGHQPSPQAMVKIVCDDHAQPQVVSKLVNLHAYRIVTAD